MTGMRAGECALEAIESNSTETNAETRCFLSVQEYVDEAEACRAAVKASYDDLVWCAAASSSPFPVTKWLVVFLSSPRVFLLRRFRIFRSFELAACQVLAS